MMIFNDQDRSGGVTLSASFGSGLMGTEMLRGVYPERSEGLSMTFPVLGVKFHHRAATPS
jgi:hypothetical protein